MMGLGAWGKKEHHLLQEEVEAGVAKRNEQSSGTVVARRVDVLANLVNLYHLEKE